MKDFKLMEKYEDAVEFLNEHPALNIYSGSFFNQFVFWVSQTCKNGIIKDSFLKDNKKVTVTFYRGSEGFDKYKDEYFDREEREDEYAMFDNLDVPYNVVYGYDWELEKYQYCGEFSVFRFNKDMLGKYICVKPTEDCKIGEEFMGMRADMLKRNISEKELEENFVYAEKDIKEDDVWLHDRRYYNAYQGEYAKADSWEKMIIALAEKAKENYGDFDVDYFLTKEEKENNRKERMFFFEEIEDDEHPYLGSRMVENKKHMKVSFAEKNLRWWDEWYKTTKHFNEHWKETLEHEEKERQAKQ